MDLTTQRWRARWHILRASRFLCSDLQMLTTSSDAVQVGKWVKEQFGLRSAVTAIFMTHAIVNDTIGVSLIHNFSRAIA